MQRALTAALVAAFLFAAIPASVHADGGPVKLQWRVGVVTPQGPIYLPVPETTTFVTIEACEAFGEAMAQRLTDWTRGRLNLDWDVRMAAVAECTGPST